MRYPRLLTTFGGVCALVATIGGCATKGQSGALLGGGIGALAGQAIGGNTKGTLIETACRMNSGDRCSLGS